MLSYQHDYHAGNHADVLKHSVLALVIRALQRKDPPLRVLDVHAGSGIYDLRSGEARKNAEHAAGIERVLARTVRRPSCCATTSLPSGRSIQAALRLYPGSPRCRASLLRPQDHLELLELHPRRCRAAPELRPRSPGAHPRPRLLRGAAGAGAARRRGGASCWWIPPTRSRTTSRRRGVADDLPRRWPGGVYLVWYPLIRHALPSAFRRVWPGPVCVASCR